MRGGGLTPTDLRTFARNRTLPQEAPDVSIYDKGPGLLNVSGPGSTEAIQDPASGLPRIPIPRTPVNRGMKWKGQSLRTLALLLASSSTTVFPAVPHPIVLGAENSEVLPSESVAVAVMFCPTLTAWLGMKVKVPVVQLEPVLTLFWPKKVLPSLVPGGFLKNWTVKVWLGLLFSFPFMVVVPEEVRAEVRLGLFCRSLVPASVSQGSFALLTLVLPRSPAGKSMRSMPKPLLAKIELERMVSVVPTSPKSTTPSVALTGLVVSPLKAMVLFCTVVALLFGACAKMNTPLFPLPRLALPFLSVPMRLPSTLLLVPVSKLKSVTPASWLPEMRLRLLRKVPPTTTLEVPAAIPSLLLPWAVVPAGLVPRKLPWILVPLASTSPKSLMAESEKLLITSPLTTVFFAKILSPSAADPAVVPSSSIVSTALVPLARVLAEEPAWE